MGKFLFQVFHYSLTVSCFLMWDTLAVGEEDGNANEIMQLGGEHLTTQIFCEGAPAMEITTWSHNDEPIIIDNSKYITTSNGDSLTVNNVEASDEGTYKCHYEGQSQDMVAACLFVLGKAGFSPCEEEPCPIETQVGDAFTLDIRISYVGAGSENRNQTTNLLYLSKDGNNLVICDEDSCDRQNEDVEPTIHQHPFDVELTVLRARFSDAGTYVATAEVVIPDTGSTDHFTKMFSVIVNPRPAPTHTTIFSSASLSAESSTESTDFPVRPVSGSTSVDKITPTSTRAPPATSSDADSTTFPVVAVVTPVVIIIVLTLVIVLSALIVVFAKQKGKEGSYMFSGKISALRPSPVGEESSLKKNRESMNEPEDLEKYIQDTESNSNVVNV